MYLRFSLSLFFIGWLPGLFHAFYVIHKYRENVDGRPTYYGGTRPQNLKVHTSDSSYKPQYRSQHQSYQSQNYQPQNYPSQNYQSQNYQPQYQSQQPYQQNY